MRLQTRAFLIVAATLMACHSESYELIEIPLGGDSAELYLGDWYDVGGVRQLRIRKTGSREPPVAVFRHPADYDYRPIGVNSTPVALVLTIQAPDRQVRVEMLLSREPKVLARGSDATLMVRGYWLFREPSRMWRMRSALFSRAERAAEGVGTFLDDLVQQL